MWSRSAAVARHEVRLLASEITSLVQIIVLPVVMMAFLKPAFRGALEAEGFRGVNGAEQAVPGMAVMFAIFMCGQIAFAFFMEHGWKTWDRLRATPARSPEIVIGKVVPVVLMLVIQQVTLFLIGMALFGLQVRGSVLVLAVVAFTYALALAALGVVLAALCRSTQQVNLLSSVLAMLLSGLGGAFVPLQALPAAARAIAPLTPPYWAMEGYRSVILEGEGLLGVAPSLVVLTGIALVAGALGAFRFRFEEAKVALG